MWVVSVYVSCIRNENQQLFNLFKITDPLTCFMKKIAFSPVKVNSEQSGIAKQFCKQMVNVYLDVTVCFCIQPTAITLLWLRPVTKIIPRRDRQLESEGMCQQSFFSGNCEYSSLIVIPNHNKRQYGTILLGSFLLGSSCWFFFFFPVKSNLLVPNVKMSFVWQTFS